MNKLLAAVKIGEEINTNGSKTLASDYSSVSPLVSSLLKNALTISSVILLFLLVFGGITFIISAGSGDEKKAGQAKSALTSALIGFAIVFSAYFIIQIIQVLTGVQILNNTSL